MHAFRLSPSRPQLRPAIAVVGACLALTACQAEREPSATAGASPDPRSEASPDAGAPAITTSPENPARAEAGPADLAAGTGPGAGTGTPAAAVPVLGDAPAPARPEDAERPQDAAQLERTGELGRDLVAALRAGRVDAALALTPYGAGPWAKLCPDLGVDEGEAEAKARAQHCARAIPWAQATDIRVAGGERRSGDEATAAGCTDEVSAFEGVTLLVVTATKRYEVELRGVVGRGEAAEAYSGWIDCGR